MEALAISHCSDYLSHRPLDDRGECLGVHVFFSQTHRPYLEDGLPVGGSVVKNHGDCKSPRPGVVGSLPFMTFLLAYKCG